MKIESFERNEADQVVAIAGTEKITLSWDFVATHKPAVGDELIQTEDGVFFGAPAEPSFVEKALEASQEVPSEPAVVEPPALNEFPPIV
jgi:hypothetical protein